MHHRYERLACLLVLVTATACMNGLSQGLLGGATESTASTGNTTGASGTAGTTGTGTTGTAGGSTSAAGPYNAPVSKPTVPYNGMVVPLPTAFAVPGMADQGDASAVLTAAVQASIAYLNAMAANANAIEHTGDANQSTLYAGEFAANANQLAGQLDTAARAAIDDASASDANVVATLVSYSAQLMGALSQISGVPATIKSAIVATSNIIGQKSGMARGTPMSAGAQYYEVTWGNGGKAGTNPASSNSQWSALSFPTGTPAPLPALPTGDTNGTWQNNAGTSAFGNGAAPVVALTAHQGYQGNCSELSGFNAVAVNNPNALIDHVKKIGPTADGLNDLYDITLYVNGTWQTLRIDSSMPANNYGANTTDLTQFWMPLYEKAIATLFGTYDAGDYFLVMQFITGSQELYGYSDPNQALADIQAGNAEEAGPSAAEGWYDAQTGAPTGAGAAGAFDLIDDHEYAVISHTATTVTLLNPWNSTQDGTGMVTLPNAVFLQLFGQFATLLPAGMVVDTSGNLHEQT